MKTKAIITGLVASLLFGGLVALAQQGGGIQGGLIDLSLSTITGTLGAANGGTGLTAAADDNAIIGNGTVWQSKAVPDCDDTGGNHLNYDTTGNSFSCGTSGSSSITGGTFTVTWTDAFTTDQTQDWAYKKIDTMVFLWPTTTVTGTSDSTSWQTAAGALPAAIRPTGSITVIAMEWTMTDNTTATAGGIRIQANGTMQMCKAATFGAGCNINGWTNTGTKAMGNQTIQPTAVYDTSR